MCASHYWVGVVCEKGAITAGVPLARQGEIPVWLAVQTWCQKQLIFCAYHATFSPRAPRKTSCPMLGPAPLV